MTGGEVLALLFVISGASLANPVREVMWIAVGFLFMALGLGIVIGELLLAEWWN